MSGASSASDGADSLSCGNGAVPWSSSSEDPASQSISLADPSTSRGPLQDVCPLVRPYAWTLRPSVQAPAFPLLCSGQRYFCPVGPSVRPTACPLSLSLTCPSAL